MELSGPLCDAEPRPGGQTLLGPVWMFIASIGSFKSTLSYVQNWQSRIFYNNGQNWLFFFENNFCCWSCFSEAIFFNWDFPLFETNQFQTSRASPKLERIAAQQLGRTIGHTTSSLTGRQFFLRLAVAMPELGWSATWMKFCVTGQ